MVGGPPPPPREVTLTPAEMKSREDQEDPLERRGGPGGGGPPGPQAGGRGPLRVEGDHVELAPLPRLPLFLPQELIVFLTAEHLGRSRETSSILLLNKY